MNEADSGGSNSGSSKTNSSQNGWFSSQLASSTDGGGGGWRAGTLYTVINSSSSIPLQTAGGLAAGECAALTTALVPQHKTGTHLPAQQSAGMTDLCWN